MICSIVNVYTLQITGSYKPLTSSIVLFTLLDTHSRTLHCPRVNGILQIASADPEGGGGGAGGPDPPPPLENHKLYGFL